MYYNFPCMRQQNAFSQVQPMFPVSPTAPMFPLTPIGGELPTGMPAGAAITPPPQIPGAIVGQVPEAPPQTVQDTSFTPGFLRTQIGRRMRVEFLIGTNGPLVDRIGTLVAVGASYILLRPIDSDDLLMCDLYSIKFVTIYY